MLRHPQLKLGPQLRNNNSRSPGIALTTNPMMLKPTTYKERRKKFARKRKLVKRCRMVDPVQERQKHPIA